MRVLPAAVTPEEAVLLGSRLSSPSELLRPLLASAWRQELLLEDIRDELRAQRTIGLPPPAEPPPAEPAPVKGGKGRTKPSTS